MRRQLNPKPICVLGQHKEYLRRSHHRRCADDNLPSFLLNGAAAGMVRAGFVVPALVPAPELAPVPAPELAPVPTFKLVLIPVPILLAEGEDDDVAGGRSSTGGKRSLSISDLRLRTSRY